MLDFGESVEAATQSSEIVQEGVGPLDDPARFAHAAAVVGVAGGEFGHDAEPAEEFSQRLRVVAAVALESVGLLARWAGLAADRRDRGQKLQHRHHVRHVGGGEDHGERDAVRIGEHVVLAAGFAAIRGVLASVLAAFGGLGEGAVDDGPRPIDEVRRVEFGQKQGVKLLPDADGVPVPQIFAAGLAAAPTEFGRQIVPGNAGLEDEEDAGENATTIERLAAGKAEPPRFQRWQ